MSYVKSGICCNSNVGTNNTMMDNVYVGQWAMGHSSAMTTAAQVPMRGTQVSDEQGSHKFP